MSWLFGSKKTKTVLSPPASDNKIVINEEDDFLIVNKQPSQDPSAGNNLPSMYPNLANSVNGITPVSPASTNHSSASINPLQGVPFQLSKTLGLATGNSQDMAALQAQAVLSSSDVRDYDYDFCVEKSVAREF
jgi:Multivesicular body subunit 12